MRLEHEGVLLSWALVGGAVVAAAREGQPSLVAGRLTGRVTVPITKVKKRTLRGSAYRSRLSEGTAQKQESRRPASPFSDVVISAHPRSFTAPFKPVTAARIDQERISFVPRVLPVTVGSAVEFVNKDRVYHNVFSLTDGADFNIGRKSTGFVHSEKIETVGPIQLFCDIHPQMTATIVSLDTPYYTMPDSTGAYVIDGLPAGEYEIRVFHPDFTSDPVSVVVQEGAPTESHFELSP